MEVWVQQDIHKLLLMQLLQISFITIVHHHSGMGGDCYSVQGSSFVAGTGISISGETISTTITQYTHSDAQAVSINNVVEDTQNLDLNSSNITGYNW